MRTQALTPSLAGALRSLAEVQLQIQASRSATLDARAIGVIAVDAAVAIFIFGASFDLSRSVALATLGLSAVLAARSLSGGSDEIGPSVISLLASNEVDDCDVLEESLLGRLAADVRSNHQALARKASRLSAALVFLALALMIMPVGGVH